MAQKMGMDKKHKADKPSGLEHGKTLDRISHKPDALLVAKGASSRKNIFKKLVHDKKNSKRAGVIVLLFFVVMGVYVCANSRQHTESSHPASAPASSTDPNDELSYRQDLISSEDYEPTYADYLIIGNEHMNRGDLVAAEENFKQAEALDGESIDVDYALATVYRRSKNQGQALAYYDRVISSASEKDSGYYTNISIYRAERKAVEAGDFDLKSIQKEYSGELPL